ncbi:MAG: hypothetical protein ACKO3P_21555, partial [Planctomycetaceae bacterium]
FSRCPPGLHFHPTLSRPSAPQGQPLSALAGNPPRWPGPSWPGLRTKLPTGWRVVGDEPRLLAWVWATTAGVFSRGTLRLVLARSKTCGVRPPPLRGDWLYAVRMHYGTGPEGTVRKGFSGRDHPEGIDLGLLARFPC